MKRLLRAVIKFICRAWPKLVAVAIIIDKADDIIIQLKTLFCPDRPEDERQD